MNKRYEKAFGLIKYIFNIDEMYEDQTRLIKIVVKGEKIF